MRRPLVLALLVLLAGCVSSPALAEAATVHWNRARRIEPAANGGLNAVSCPTSRLCVAVDASGDVSTSTRPTADRAWSKPFHVDSRGELTGVSCPTTRLCVAVDAVGDIVTSTDPTGGHRAWTLPARVDATGSPFGGYAGLRGISCPTTGLCVAVDGAPRGNVVVSTDPTGGPGAWHRATIGGTLTSVSCAADSLCVAVGSAHWVSTDPTAGPQAWHGSGASGNAVFSAIDCPGSDLCVAVAFGNASPGLAAATRNPRGAGAWKTTDIETAPPPFGDSTLDAVGCLGAGLCVALDSSEAAFVSDDPGAGRWGSGAAIRSRAAAQTTAIACRSTFCVVVDSAGIETTGIRRG